MMGLMRSLAAACCLCGGFAYAEPPPLPLPWVKLSEIYYTPTQARLYGSGGSTLNCGAPAGSVSLCNAVYIQTHGAPGTNEGPQTPNVPITIDLRPFGVADDAKAAFLSGILVITHGNASELAEVRVTFAADDGSPFDCSRYLGQAGEASIGNGIRSNMATWVPLTGGKFRLCYYIGTPGNWPANSSYAINLSVQAWGR